ncbi:unnamed protein product [Boreogadus saida]
MSDGPREALCEPDCSDVYSGRLVTSWSLVRRDVMLRTLDFWRRKLSSRKDMEEVFHNMAAEEDLRVNAMFLGRWVDIQ